MKRYDQARKDFEALERIAELHDQVGLDEERLNLMREPTKAKAADLYEMGIRLWFKEHGLSDSRAFGIAERHNIP